MKNKENVSCVVDEVAAIAERAFAEGLASSIMAGFPVAGIIAIFKGIKGLKLANKARDLANEHGIFAGGKNIAARVLAISGIASGAYATLVYLFFALMYVAWIAIYLLCILGILFVGFLTGI